jgi:hypothetical protein
LALDDAQQTTMLSALGERADGSWAASEVGDFKGRQAGKGDSENARLLAGLQLFGERLLLHTAHEFPTANEAFLRLVGVHENFDDLRKQVARIRYANGEQGIEYTNGARLKYRARTGGSSRGFAEADVVIYDEAQNIHPEHLAASLPTMLANPNFQAWFGGSGGFSHSSVAHRMRKRAILGDGSRLAFTENTAQTVTVLDGKITLSSPPADQFLSHDVLSTHPGFAAGRVSFETMQTMFRALGPDMFGREILNIWEPEPDDEYGGPISVDAWVGLGKGGAIVSHHHLALAVAHDRTRASFGLAGRTADGQLLVKWKWIGTPSGVLAEGRRLWAERRLPVRVQSAGASAPFIPLLIEAGIDVVPVSTAEAAQATGQLIDAARAGGLTHEGQPELLAALIGAQVAVTPQGAMSWSPKSQVDISVLQAVTIAAGGVPAAVEAFFVY